MSRCKLLRSWLLSALAIGAASAVLGAGLDSPMLVQTRGQLGVEFSALADEREWNFQAESPSRLPGEDKARNMVTPSRAAQPVEQALGSMQDVSGCNGFDCNVTRRAHGKSRGVAAGTSDWADVKDLLSQQRGGSASSVPSGPRPNFVIFFGDDWGWGDLGANWPPAKGLTDNLDKIAEQGVRFTDFHVGASVCTPSRAALMTGRSGLRTGVIQNFNPDSIGGLPRNETTIAELLQANGYLTGMIGKWHLGTAPGFHPVDRGFGSYLGVPYSIDMGCAAPRANTSGEEFDPEDGRAHGCPGAYGGYDMGLPVFRNRTIVQQPADLDALSKMYDQEVHRFISMAAASSKPFLLYFAASHVHVPNNHAPGWEKRVQTPFATRVNGGEHFAGAVMEMDNSAGEILKALQKAGITNDTVIVLTGDNGPWEVKCNMTGTSGPYTGLWQKEVDGGGSSSKFTVWEGGHRVPGVISWPSHIRPRVSSALVSAFDMFPTIAALAGVSLPTARNYDGIDLRPVLLDGVDRGNSVLFHLDTKTESIGAVRNGSLKAVWNVGGEPGCDSGENMLLSRESRRIRTVREDPLVFDLDRDPAEQWPLNATSRPDISKIISMFNSLLRGYLDDVDKDMTSTASYDTGFEGTEANCCNSMNDFCACEDHLAKADDQDPSELLGPNSFDSFDS